MKNFMERVPQEVAEEIFKTLDDIGVKQHLCGYNYTACAIASIVGDTNKGSTYITKEVYPYVARMFGTSSQIVERGIRTVVENLFYKSGNTDTLYKYFGNSVNPSTGKVTNAQFIYTLSGIFTRRKMFQSTK